ncbi:MAG: hypothetical protein WCD73_22915, partial [Pseudolabrys sp.]
SVKHALRRSAIHLGLLACATVAGSVRFPIDHLVGAPSSLPKRQNGDNIAKLAWLLAGRAM